MKRPVAKRFAMIVLLALVVGGVISWYAGVRNFFFPDNFGVVEPGKIYRSAQINRMVIRRTLVDNNIKVIVNLSSDDTADRHAEEQIAKEIGVEHILVPGLGGRGVGNPDAYPQAIKAIVDANRAGKAVLVHCQTGSQRTSGVIAVYQMLVEGKPEAEAFKEAERFHFRQRRNPYLIPFVNEHLAEWKAKLQSMGIIPSETAVSK